MNTTLNRIHAKLPQAADNTTINYGFIIVKVY